MHKPIIDPSEVYERIIIWADSNFIENHNHEDCDLLTCFKLANEKSFNLIRLDAKLQDNIKFIIESLNASFNSKDFGSKLLSNSLFIQLLVYLNRVHINNTYINEKDSLKFDKQIEGILKYINSNLQDDLSAESLSQKFYISRYYLMHKFKKETGYTLHNYINQKRLLMAKDLIISGEQITKASIQCGFNDYSCFLRSFKKLFEKAPKDFSPKSKNNKI